MSDIEWRDLPWEGYQVSDDGKVRSTATNWRGYGTRELRATPDNDGYLAVRLTNDGKRVRYRVHRLVAFAFIGERPFAGAQLRHLNGIQADNRAANLAWGTALENAVDRESHGHTSRGQKHSDAIRQSGQADGIRQWVANRKQVLQ